jgi:hypothetical protein
MHTVLVDDSRPRSGENAAMARVITQLPFNDTGDSTTFGDNVRCQATVSMLACRPLMVLQPRRHYRFGNYGVDTHWDFVIAAHDDRKLHALLHVCMYAI